MIRIPVNRCEDSRKIQQAKRDHQNEEMDNNFLKTEKSLMNLARVTNSIDEEQSDKLFKNDYNYYGSEVEKEVLLKLLKEELYESFNQLTEEEKMIIMMRYGLFDQKIYSGRKLAKEIGKNRNYVKRLEVKALKKMQKDLDYCDD